MVKDKRKNSAEAKLTTFTIKTICEKERAKKKPLIIGHGETTSAFKSVTFLFLHVYTVYIIHTP